VVVRTAWRSIRDWAGYEMHAEGFRSAVPLFERFGIATARELDVEHITTDMHAEVEATGQPAMITPHVCAWPANPCRLPRCRRNPTYKTSASRYGLVLCVSRLHSVHLRGEETFGFRA
jgi:hypothetical protein